MGKCVSKHPTALAVALSQQDLAAANKIWSKFAESSEYIALKDEHGNQLCEYYYVSNKDGDRHHCQEELKRQLKPKFNSKRQKSKQKHQHKEVRPSKQQRATRKTQENNDNDVQKKEADDVGIAKDDDDDEAAIKATAKHIAIALPATDDVVLDASNINNKSQHNDDGQHCWSHLCLLGDGQQQQQLQQALAQMIPVAALAAVTTAPADANNNGLKQHKNHRNKSKQQTSKNISTLTCRGGGSLLVGERLSVPNILFTHYYAEDWFCQNEGQTESKKNAKKQQQIAGAVETKGTAMSFGFRKKLNTTPKKLKKLIEGDFKKKQDKCNNVGEHGGTYILTDTDTTDAHTECRDDNGNAAEPTPKVHFEKVGAAAVAAAAAGDGNVGAIQGVVQPDHGQTTRPGAGNRFGYRGSHAGGVVRPASTGVTSTRFQQRETYDNMENNNFGSSVENRAGQPLQGCLVSNLKRRSKSAHAGRALTSNQGEQEANNGAAPPKITQPKTITFNLNQNSTIEYQRRQFFQQPTGSANGRAAPHMGAAPARQPQSIIHTGMHTNVIVRPMPRVPPAAYSKFTLHTVSLPKPEFPVAISLSATTPTTPGSVYTPSPTSVTGARAKDLCAPHPLTVAQSQTHQHMDLKTAKQMANNTRRGFTGSREISADSGIASMDMALDSSTSSGGGRSTSPKRNRSRPRNLQMVMSGRHKFEVRDLDDPLSSESSSMAVEPLALPKLPAENQTVPLPLSGLVRSNTVLSREAFEHKNNANNTAEVARAKPAKPIARVEIPRNPSEESESIDEEKLFLDRSTSEKSNKYQFRDINTCSSKTSSPGSSIMSSWCNNAGESLAAKDCSSLSISSSEDSNKLHDKLNEGRKQLDLPLEINEDDDMSIINTDMQISTISSITETTPQFENANKLQNPSQPANNKIERPNSLFDCLNETKFAEMALAGSTYLLDDETSPTDSLVSSTESEEAATKQKKHKMNEELQEKDIDEISPELEVGSPISPGTPTHASHSLSLSDCGNLIDDEIADQPALLFNNNETTTALDAADSLASHKEKTDTPTLMETGSMRSLKSQSKARTALQQAIELSLRTPVSLRKAVMERAESLDTLSPCESICSDDLMGDFDVASSLDSIDRSASIKSRSGSDLNKISDTELFSELDRKGSDVMKELNSIMRVRSSRCSDKESVIAHLPARATRLLNRSRLQQQCPLNNADSDSSKSAHSVRRSTANSRASTATTSHAAAQQSRHQHAYRDIHSSSDDLMLYDKSFRNAMIQDVLQFKKQLLRLRRILQEDEDCLTRTETLNPFENDNGQLFASCGLDSKLLDDIDLASLTSSTTDDPMQELADLRRQVVYLQGQVDDRERTIRLQRNQIEKLEAEKTAPAAEGPKECINMATQTERTRPLSIGPEGLSRSKPEYTSYMTYFPAVCSSDPATITQQQQQYPSQCVPNQTRRHTIISATLTNYNHQLTANATTPACSQHQPRRASIAWEKPSATYKPVKITLIGEPLKSIQNGSNEQKPAVNGKPVANGISGTQNGFRHPENGTSYVQLQQLQQPCYQPPPSTRNGNLNPTVTIV